MQKEPNILETIGEVFTDPTSAWDRFRNGKNGEIAESNLDLQQQQLEYQKELNKLQMQREDTSFQRQMRDWIDAGVNPYLMIENGGGNAGASAGMLNAGEAPQQEIYDQGNQGIFDTITTITNNKKQADIAREQLNEQRKVNADNMLTSAQERKIKAEQNERDAKQRVEDAESHVKEMEAMENKNEQTKAQIETEKQKLNNLKTEYQKTQAEVKQTEQEIKRVQKEISILNAQRYDYEQKWKTEDYNRMKLQAQAEIESMNADWHKKRGKAPSQEEYEKWKAEMIYKYAELGEKTLNDMLTQYDKKYIRENGKKTFNWSKIWNAVTNTSDITIRKK